MKHLRKQSLALITAAVCGVLPLLPAIPVSADTVSYPVQEIRIGIANTDRNLYANDGNLSSQTETGSRNEKWSITYVSDGIYEIVQSASGALLTVQNGTCTLAADTDSSTQRWNIVGVQNDFDGYTLYYKIVSNADSSQALTFSPETNTFSTTAYTGATYQKFKLNCDGLEGFAANCQVAEGEKAGTIGGLLGKTVIVSTVEDFKSALDSTEPLTIVVNGNLDMQKEYHTRIRDNKTIVGAYGTNQIADCMLRTNNEYGNEGDNPSDNIIIRNIDFRAKNVEDRILINIWSSRNIWVDHCTFVSELTRDRDEVGKFIWLNTPYESYLDAKDRLRSPDYITLSYNIFRNRYWTVAYGTQNEETTRCRTSVMYNWWDQCVRRCPQIGNGIGHIYNNFYSGTDSGIPDGTSQMIPGEGSTYLSENCRFECFKGVEVAIDANAKYRDSGSYTADNSTSTPYLLANTLKKKNYTQHDWTPSQENYGYALIAGYNTSNTDTKQFCKTYAGCFSSYDKIKYITDSDLQNYVVQSYAEPFLTSISVGTEPVEKTGAVMDTSVKYMFKNVGSQKYLEVANGTAENGTNVQQWGADGFATHNSWKLISAGDGYYYIRSYVGDGKTYFLDLEYGKQEDGTNIGIWQDTQSDAQLLKFVDNGDGSYTITTKATEDKSCVAVASDSTDSGANIVQWTCNGKDSQKWIAEIDTIKDGATLDESACYMLKNVNSGLYMEVKDGAAQAGATVQQWGANGAAAHNVWHVKAINWGYYYVYSALGDGESFVLNLNNGNNAEPLTIETNNKLSTQYFKFVDNEDGTYTIVTRASKDLSCVEVANAATNG
ncbi:MAG: RICIN domain-containing protein, partial [Oscillospiraceae bacterium]|nr:RICIN domain-containing protein [Oscillospiraceae bacterium]